MKKYLSGLIAIALAIGFSAFTSQPTRAPQKQQDLYWYPVDYSSNSLGVIDVNNPAFSGDPQSTEFADENDGCTPGLRDCLRGFSSIQTSPTTDAGQDQTKKPMNQN